MRRKCFTLVEMIVVIAIISVITVSLWTAFAAFTDKYGNDTSALQRLKAEYNFTYYDDFVLPEPVDYKGILAKYGIDINDFTDEEIMELVKELNAQ